MASPLLRASIVILLTMLFHAGSSLWAQDQQRRTPYKTEIFGSFGRGGFYHGDNHLGNGLDLGAGLGIRPFTGSLRGLGFEVMYNGISFGKAWGNGYENKGDVRVVTGNVLYHFGRSRTEFFLVGGIGALDADYTLRNPYYSSLIGDPDYLERQGGTKMAIDFGAGLKIRVLSKLWIRPEARFYDTTIGTGYNWAYLRASLAIGYQF